MREGNEFLLLKYWNELGEIYPGEGDEIYELVKFIAGGSVFRFLYFHRVLWKGKF